MATKNAKDAKKITPAQQVTDGERNDRKTHQGQEQPATSDLMPIRSPRRVHLFVFFAFLVAILVF